MLDVIARFQKEIFSADAIREFGRDLTYTAKMVDFLRNEIDVRDSELSESLMRWILALHQACMREEFSLM